MGTQSSTNPPGLTSDRGTGRPSCYRLKRCIFFLALCSILPPLVAQTTPAASVPLLLPTTVVFDTAGNLYVAETNRNVIDRIDASGNLTVIAGNGTQGFSGDLGPATSAQLDSPQGIAIDSSQNLYIADTHNHRIRMVSAANGTIATIAGNGSPGFQDASQAISARLNMPLALALDSAGNLDIADANNHRIRQLTLATGSIRTIAGNGTQGFAGDGASALNASIDSPTGLAVDALGNLYLADSHNHRVRRIAHDTGTITSVPTSSLALPRGLTFDAAGNLYIADTQANRVLRIAADGTVSLVAGEGTQGFAGDNGSATSALLDSPRSPAISPAGLIAIADTGNQRIRQFHVDGTIQTFGGVNPTRQSVLSLNAPSVVQYGTGSLTAVLTSQSAAAGTVTFFESTNSLLAMLGSGSLAANAAAFSTARLSAGAHRIVATYSGDATHASVQSSVIALTITPAQVSASPASVGVLYGQTLPALTGTIAGVLPQDAGLVTGLFASSAEMLSPSGKYPIAATLSGAASGNYQIGQTASAFLTIAQAPSVTSLVSSAASAMQGSTLTLLGKVVSTTQGVPTGRLTFLDGANAMGSSVLDASGAASVAEALSVGTHSVTALYSGDGNFLPSTSSAVSTVIVGASGASTDFSLSASGAASQTVAAGSSVSYPFAVAVLNGPLNGPIVLSASGMPLGATTTFSPAYLPPGGAVSTFTFSVQTAKTSALLMPRSHPLWAFVMLGLWTLIPAVRRKRLRGVAAMLLLGSVCGCGDRIASLPVAATSPAKVYPITITATSTLASGSVLQHAASVTLTLQ